MLPKYKEDMLISMFCQLDDFCATLENWKAQRPGQFPVPTRKPRLSDSELMAIYIFYQHSGYKCFQYYYENMVATTLKTYFPGIPSYPRFVGLIPYICPGLFLFLKYQTHKSRPTGIYFVDSKRLPVCDNRRIKSNKVFKDVARRGKSSTGWFYGFKVHLVINNHGEIMNFNLAPANIADNNHALLRELLAGLKGECYGDKGYLTTLFEEFYNKGLHIITKAKKNMKGKLIPLDKKLKLRKRGVIESVNDLLNTVFDIEHTRHRSPVNACAQMLAALIAYTFYPSKPSVFVAKENDKLLVA